MHMKFAVALFVALIANVSLGDDVTATPSSEAAATGETSESSGSSGISVEAPADSPDGSNSESSTEDVSKESITPKLETSDLNVKLDSEKSEDTVPTEGGDGKNVQETEIPIQKREDATESPKGNETPGSTGAETSKPAETGEPAVSTVEPNKTCIISNATHWSWLVKILDKETGKQVCTGTLITDEDILVPASCFMENTTQEVPESFYTLPTEIMAIAGGGVDTDCMQVRNISVIYPHKGYFDNSEEHDYAFLKVSPEFDVDDDDIPDIRYHLNVINSEGGLVSIHNNGPFCESPYFVDDGMNAKVSDEIHLLGMRIEDCMMIWNCSADFDTCLSYLHPASHACLKPLAPRKCGPRDKGAPLVCDEVFLGYLHQCDGELPMIFRGLNKAIKFLELEDDHVQRPGYLGRHY